jgi:hypothetical protein
MIVQMREAVQKLKPGPLLLMRVGKTMFSCRNFVTMRKRLDSACRKTWTLKAVWSMPWSARGRSLRRLEQWERER